MKKNYRKILSKMFSVHPDKRPNPVKVLDVFEKILLDLYLDELFNKQDSYPRAVESGFKEGVRLRKALHHYAMHFYCEDVLQLKKLEKVITDALDHVVNVPSAIHHFLDRAKVDFLKQVHFNNAQEEVRGLLASYKDYHNRLGRLQSDIKKLEQQTLTSAQVKKLDDVKRIIKNISFPPKTFPLRLDNIYFFTERYAKYVPHLEMELGVIKQYVRLNAINTSRFFYRQTTPLKPQPSSKIERRNAI